MSKKPRCAIVSSATIAKYKRLDPGFYLGQVEGEEAQDRVDAAKKRLESAERSYQRALDEQKESDERVEQMIQDGEIVPWPPTNSSD